MKNVFCVRTASLVALTACSLLSVAPALAAPTATAPFWCENTEGRAGTSRVHYGTQVVFTFDEDKLKNAQAVADRLNEAVARQRLRPDRITALQEDRDRFCLALDGQVVFRFGKPWSVRHDAPGAELLERYRSALYTALVAGPHAVTRPAATLAQAPAKVTMASASIAQVPAKLISASASIAQVPAEVATASGSIAHTPPKVAMAIQPLKASVGFHPVTLPTATLLGPPRHGKALVVLGPRYLPRLAPVVGKLAPVSKPVAAKVAPVAEAAKVAVVSPPAPVKLPAEIARVAAESPPEPVKLAPVAVLAKAPVPRPEPVKLTPVVKPAARHAVGAASWEQPAGRGSRVYWRDALVFTFDEENGQKAAQVAGQLNRLSQRGELRASRIQPGRRGKRYMVNVGSELLFDFERGFATRQGMPPERLTMHYVDKLRTALGAPSYESHVASAVSRGNFGRESLIGLASWYGGFFHGRRAADGTRFDQNDLTAAHKTLPLGTLVLVTNMHSRKSAIVRVTDRGPYVRGRMLDLSRGAAQAIGMLHAGVCQVKVQILNKPARSDRGARQG